MNKMSHHEISEKLVGIISSMKADSYELDIVNVESQALHLRIEALDGACEDCLVPSNIMTTIISTALDGRYSSEQIRIEYPDNQEAH